MSAHQTSLSVPGLDSRFLEGDTRVAEWSMGGAMFGLTAAVVQMLIRSLIIKRNNVTDTFSLLLKIKLNVSVEQKGWHQENGQEETSQSQENGRTEKEFNEILQNDSQPPQSLDGG